MGVPKIGARSFVNGGRANLGAHDDTAEASRSAPEPGSLASAVARSALATVRRARASIDGAPRAG